MKNKIRKITTNLGFTSEAVEAVNYYTSIFNNSRIGRITRDSVEREEWIFTYMENNHSFF